MEELTLLGERAVQAKYELQRMTTEKKNEVLEAVAEALIQNTEYLLLENHKDLERGIANQMNPGLVGPAPAYEGTHCRYGRRNPVRL